MRNMFCLFVVVSVPEDMAKRHKRPLWTNRSSLLKKAKTQEHLHDVDDTKEESASAPAVQPPIVMIPTKATSHRILPMKRKSVLLPPNESALKDRNPMKRTSWNGGPNQMNGGKKLNNKLSDILQAAAQNNQQSEAQGMNGVLFW